MYVCVWVYGGGVSLLTIILTLAMETFRYFSMPYPLPKLDMVAVPEFSGGAMENYGLIVYLENDMLYNDLRSTAARKQRVCCISNCTFSFLFSFAIL